MADAKSQVEGGLDAPTRHPLGWQAPSFYDGAQLERELYRVFDICHGCRRCVSLCNAFPTLFDLVDSSETLEVDGVAPADYSKVVEHCYLCDLCYQTKCPYVPPHPWNIDFPHLMLRAKAVQFRKGEVGPARKLLTSTTAVGRLASIPVVAEAVNAANRSPTLRKALDGMLGVHPQAGLPEYHARTARRRVTPEPARGTALAAGPTRGKVAIFVTCYGNYNRPQIVEDLVAVLRHNGIETRLIERERCCGMPKLEIGDLDSVRGYKEANLPVLAAAVREGWDLMAAIPSCVLMFKQEIPLMFPDEAEVQSVRRAFFDPFEYLAHRRRAGLLNLDFRQPLGKVVYHAPCHQRVQNIGPKTREILALIPDTQIDFIERCSGHNGTYGVRTETYEVSMRIGRPVAARADAAQSAFVSSDCPMASDHIAHGMSAKVETLHPVSLLKKAYGL
jgi:glycerol-3-phosphate dehydrogenase subunit C